MVYIGITGRFIASHNRCLEKKKNLRQFGG